MIKNIRSINLFMFVILVVLIVIFAGFLLFPASETNLPVVVTYTPPGFSVVTDAPYAQPTIVAPVIPTATMPSSLPSVEIVPTFPTTQPAQATPNSQPSSGSIVIQEEYLPDGMYLNLQSETFTTGYRLGPLARGAYVVGPNERFLAYITNYGQVFAFRFGDDHFVRIANMRRAFAASARNVDPSYRLSFYDNGIAVTLIISEDVYGQTITVVLPRAITH